MNEDYIAYLERKPLKHLYVDGAGRSELDHADSDVQTADKFIGSTLVAKTNVKIYGYPGGAVVATRFPAQTVGTVYSWKEVNGDLWWMLEGGKGWVKHEKGAFDNAVAQTTGSGAAHDEHVKELTDLSNQPDTIDKLASGATGVLGGIGNTLNTFGQYLPWIIGALALFVIVTAMAKVKSI